ncbi:MAG TPA: PIN domain-containing protein, partial [Gammaproteobacteria bacterium]
MTSQALERLFLLDTNVLMHDPGALFRFQEHDIYLPMVVLEELDSAKKGLSEVSRNVRQVSRFLDQIIGDADTAEISKGLRLSNITHTNGGPKPNGCLFLQTQLMADHLPETLPGKNADNSILGTTLSLQKEFPDKVITLVSKDINLRIKARILGIHTEDYYN